MALTVTLLTNNWMASFTGGETPDIDDDASGEKYNRGTNGIVLVFEHGPYDRERVDTPGDFKDHTRHVTLRVFAKTRAKLDDLLGEVERIYNTVKDNPEGGGSAQHWDWITDMGETPQKDYPGVFDTHVEWAYWAHSIPEAT